MSAPPGSTPPSDDDADLVRWLANHDAACPMCGYNLRALATPRCPECGERLRLSVSVVDPRMGPWILMFASLCGAAGIGSFGLLVMILRRKVEFRMIPIIATIPIAIAAIYTRRLFQRKLSDDGKWALAVGITGGLIVMFWAIYQTIH
jgi:hypothetical protein